jgi:polyferredoxin
VQLVALGAFLVLLRWTEYGGRDELPRSIRLALGWDPLAAAASVAAGGGLSWLFAPAMTLLLLTPLLGRFFCGWLCPMGTTLDLIRRAAAPSPPAKKSPSGESTGWSPDELLLRVSVAWSQGGRVITEALANERRPVPSRTALKSGVLSIRASV